MHEKIDKDTENDDYISRTSRKKFASEFKDTAEQLLNLNNAQRATIPLSNVLLEAITTAKKITSGNALKRQISYIGKIIRKDNPEAIEAALENLKQKDNMQHQQTLLAQLWLDRLTTEGAQALGDFIQQFPNCNRQQLNQLLRNTNKEILAKNNDGNEQKKHQKILFKSLRETISEKQDEAIK